MTEQTEQQSQIVNIDGVDYEFDSLSQQSKYLLIQLQDLNMEESKLRAALDRVAAARKTFFASLKEELDKPTEGELADKLVS